MHLSLRSAARSVARRTVELQATRQQMLKKFDMFVDYHVTL
jgi:hypothetical protein